MSRFITYLMLDHPATVTAQATIAGFRELAGPSPMSIEPHGPAKSPLGEAFIVLVGGAMPVTVMFVDQPLPTDAWEEAAARSIIWPDAAEAARRTRAHVIVALLNDTSDHGMALYGATAVTMVAGALAQRLPVAAVVFTEAQSITKGTNIIAAAADLGAGRGLPDTVWTTISFLHGAPLADGTPTTAALTIGLLPFVGRELEFQPVSLPALEIARRMVGLCNYLILKGPVIKDGDTVGVSEEEKIRVRYAARGQRPGIPVMLLSLKAADPTAKE